MRLCSPRKEEGRCTGTKACVFGFKVEANGIDEWWKQVKKGFELVKEVAPQTTLMGVAAGNLSRRLILDE
jgi:hypothetical protein